MEEFLEMRNGRKKMATYVISDIHGEYEKFMELLEEIELEENDTLYVLGDVLDRGKHPDQNGIKTDGNAKRICLVGNHEVMALKCLQFLCQEITNRAIDELDEETAEDLLVWLYNGGDSTIREFRALDPEMRQEVMAFLEDFELHEEVCY